MEALKPGKDQSMPAPRKYPDELRERAVRMVLEVRAETGTNRGAVVRVAEWLGIYRLTATLRYWAANT